MPIYEYKCRKCGTHLEKRQKVTDDPLKECESCGGELEKQWSRTGFQFKGDGWYVTDYASKKNTGGADKTEKSSGSESTSPAEPASKPSSGPAKTDT
jgi:putative FmdB family regulatory protein